MRVVTGSDSLTHVYLFSGKPSVYKAFQDLMRPFKNEMWKRHGQVEGPKLYLQAAPIDELASARRSIPTDMLARLQYDLDTVEDTFSAPPE